MNPPRLTFLVFILLLIWTPLVFGAMHAVSYSLLELHAFLLVVMWMGHIMLARRRSGISTKIVWTPIAIPVALFLILLILQILPLPPAVLRALSPSTEELYRLFLPDGLTTRMPLSLNRYATQVALVKLLAYTGVFFVVVNIVRTRRQIRTVSWTIIGVATAMAILGMVQRYYDFSVLYAFRDASLIGNDFGPYVNGNHFAGYEVMAILLGLGLLLSYTADDNRDEPGLQTRAHGRSPSVLSPPRLLLIGCLVVMVSALIQSRSRGGFVAFLCGLVGFAMITRFRQQSRQRPLGLTVVFVVIGAGLLWFGAPLLTRFADILTGQEALSWGGGRMAVYQATWNMANDFPLFGIGFEAFASIFPRYQQPQALLQSYSHAHNDVLQLLAEMGRVGFVVAATGVMLGLGHFVRYWRQYDSFGQIMVAAGLSACLALGMHSLLDFKASIVGSATWLSSDLNKMSASPLIEVERRGRPRHP